MLQALTARMQATIDRRKAAIEALKKANIQMAMKHDIQLAIARAELQMAKNRLRDL